MNDSTNKRPIIVGLFVIVGLLILLAGILTIGNIRETFTKKMKVTTLFDDVNGLLPGSNVWFSGVKIGTVKKLDFYGKSQVSVILNIDTEIQDYIRKDAKVKISTDGLIGNKIIVIYGGTSQAGAIQEGDTLNVEKTISTEEMMSTFQESNKNLLSITTDFKALTTKIMHGEGTIGKFLTDESVYNNINAATNSIQHASERAQVLMSSIATYTAKLNKEGTLANDIVTDTIIFNSIRASVTELQQIADSAAVMVNDLKKASNDPNSAVGVLLRDKESGDHIKATIKNLESSSVKLDEDLEALQHNFLTRRYFKKKEKAAAKAK